MRIVPLGSVGAMLHLDWFLNNHDIKLVRNRKKRWFVDLLQTLSLFNLFCSLKIEVIPKNKAIRM